MSDLGAPKNLTRNVLWGMFLGFAIGSIFFYTSFLPATLEDLVTQFVLNLGGDIFKNLLKLIVVPLVFFSLVAGISSVSDMMKLGNIALKTILLVVVSTAVAVSMALFFGWMVDLGAGYQAAAGNFDIAIPQVSFYDTLLNIFPNNLFGAFVENNMLGIVFFSILFGIAVNATDHLTGNLSKAFEKLNTVFLKIVLMIMGF
ncbi:MAG: dicarboxylate/amino acid:cation symporter, partial [Gammaproteobacteria bacterium]